MKGNRKRMLNDNNRKLKRVENVGVHIYGNKRSWPWICVLNLLYSGRLGTKFWLIFSFSNCHHKWKRQCCSTLLVLKFVIMSSLLMFVLCMKILFSKVQTKTPISLKFWLITVLIEIKNIVSMPLCKFENIRVSQEFSVADFAFSTIVALASVIGIIYTRKQSGNQCSPYKFWSWKEPSDYFILRIWLIKR